MKRIEKNADIVIYFAFCVKGGFPGILLELQFAEGGLHIFFLLIKVLYLFNDVGRCRAVHGLGQGIGEVLNRCMYFPYFRPDRLRALPDGCIRIVLEMKAFRIQADLLKLFQKIVIYQFHAVKTGIADR